MWPDTAADARPSTACSTLSPPTASATATTAAAAARPAGPTGPTGAPFAARIPAGTPAA